MEHGIIWRVQGAMKSSQWFQVGGKYYYVNASGALAVNTTVDGYRVDSNRLESRKNIKKGLHYHLPILSDGIFPCFPL